MGFLASTAGYLSEDRAHVKPRDPCSVAVIFSDCAAALKNIGNNASGGVTVVQNIVDQSIELERLGMEVRLHRVPGHRNIPGN